MTCNPELVTAYVDEALEPAERVALESHFATCADCAAQRDAERALKRRLREEPHPQPPAGFEADVRSRLAILARRPRRGRVWLSLAAVLALVFFWARGAAPLVGWELARDHFHCFGQKRLPAQMWSGDGMAVTRWYESHGREVPLMPNGAAGLVLVGARICPLLDGTRVAHLYYVGEEEHRVSVYVVPHGVRFHTSFAETTSGASVRLMHVGTATVGIVAEQPDDLDAFTRALSTTVASLE